MPDFVQSLIDFFRRPAEDTADAVPEGACPNCWGRYEYDGEVREQLRDRQLDVNRGREAYAFIQKFAVEHVDGIRLREENGRMKCPSCGSTGR